MGTKNTPGRFDCYANAAPDEPMFVLLGRDRHAPAPMRHYHSRENAEAEADLIAEVLLADRLKHGPIGGAP